MDPDAILAELKAAGISRIPDAQLLMLLAEYDGAGTHFSTLAERSGEPEETTAGRVLRLRKAGLIDKVSGKSKEFLRYAITVPGRALLISLDGAGRRRSTGEDLKRRMIGAKPRRTSNPGA